MNRTFLRPRLVGRRFDEHPLPLDILKVFAAVEEILFEPAKRQCLAANPDKVRSARAKALRAVVTRGWAFIEAAA